MDVREGRVNVEWGRVDCLDEKKNIKFLVVISFKFQLLLMSHFVHCESNTLLLLLCSYFVQSFLFCKLGLNRSFLSFVKH